MRGYVIAILGMMVLGASAQTEATERHLPAISVDTLHLEKPELLPQLQKPATDIRLTDGNAPIEQTHQPLIPTMDMSIPRFRPTMDFNLWKGASLTVNGMQQAMPGLMGINAGNVTLRQDFGRLHLTASGLANKYWMPGINSMMGPVGVPILHTQWGFGGTLSYDVSPAFSLHAFGTYYATNPLVGAAMSPYINTTKFGGFADISINKHFGSYVGAERYVNPISGKWTTDPIVTPYIKVGKHNKSRIEFPVGQILKTLIWGDQYNPMRFRPLPPRQHP
ncbi:MAG: hypothetical protein IJ067_06045 [Prevotella sp.]|nr:hypothetical protein [Prevotella sp.]